MAARISIREQQKRQARQRRWLASLGLAIGFGVLLSGGAFGYHYLSQPGRLPLRVIEVNGELSQLQHDEIQSIVVDAIDGGFFSCDMQKLRKAVLAMPWVEDVSIRRVWPDRLSMTVTEQVPLARWGDDALISVNGGVFRPGRLDDHAGLVRLYGPSGSEQRVVAFFQGAVGVARQRGLQIVAVEQDERRHWWVRFDGGMTVSLGHEAVAQRLAQFYRVYPSLVASQARQPERVDMRYAHGFAVRWKDATDAPAAADMKSQEKV